MSAFLFIYWGIYAIMVMLFAITLWWLPGVVSLGFGFLLLGDLNLEGQWK